MATMVSANDGGGGDEIQLSITDTPKVVPPTDRSPSPVVMRAKRSVPQQHQQVPDAAPNVTPCLSNDAGRRRESLGLRGLTIHAADGPKAAILDLPTIAGLKALPPLLLNLQQQHQRPTDTRRRSSCYHSVLQSSLAGHHHFLMPSFQSTSGGSLTMQQRRSSISGYPVAQLRQPEQQQRSVSPSGRLDGRRAAMPVIEQSPLKPSKPSLPSAATAGPAAAADAGNPPTITVSGFDDDDDRPAVADIDQQKIDADLAAAEEAVASAGTSSADDRQGVEHEQSSLSVRPEHDRHHEDGADAVGTVGDVTLPTPPPPPPSENYVPEHRAPAQNVDADVSARPEVVVSPPPAPAPLPPQSPPPPPPPSVAPPPPPACPEFTAEFDGDEPEMESVGDGQIDDDVVTPAAMNDISISVSITANASGDRLTLADDSQHERDNETRSATNRGSGGGNVDDRDISDLQQEAGSDMATAAGNANSSLTPDDVDRGRVSLNTSEVAAMAVSGDSAVSCGNNRHVSTSANQSPSRRDPDEISGNLVTPQKYPTAERLAEVGVVSESHDDDVTGNSEAPTHSGLHDDAQTNGVDHVDHFRRAEAPPVGSIPPPPEVEHSSSDVRGWDCREPTENRNGEEQMTSSSMPPASPKQPRRSTDYVDAMETAAGKGDEQRGRGGDGGVPDGLTEVIINKGNLGLGFCIAGGKGSSTGDQPIVVKRIFGGDTPVRGCLEPGDEIVSANGLDFSRMSHHMAWTTLKSLPEGQITLLIRREH